MPKQTERRLSSRLGRLVADAWLVLGVTLLLVLLADAVLREVVPDLHGPLVVPGTASPDKADAPFYRDASWAARYWSEHDGAKAMRWQPWVYWRRQPFRGETIHVDDQGIRATWQPAGEPQSTVWMFGGSTVWGTGVPDDQTIPSHLARMLAEAGHPVEMVNFGESGYVSGQSLALLIDRLRNMTAPDLVIFYEGANDVFAALQAGRAGWPQNESHRAADFRVTDGLDNWLAAFPKVLEGVQRWAGRRPEIEVSGLATSIAEQVRANARMANALGREFGFEFMLFWQPTLFAREPVGAHETAALGSSLALHRDLQRAADEAIGGMRETPIIDLSAVLDQRREALYQDFVHLGPTGNRLVAEAMLGDVLTALERRWVGGLH